MADPEGYFQAFVRLRSRSTGEWLVPPELREKLAADARERGSNLTEVVVSILARRYNVACDPTVRGTAPSPTAEHLNLRLPMELYRELELARIASGRRSYQLEFLAALCAHYGLRLPVRPSRRRARPGPTSARAAA